MLAIPSMVLAATPNWTGTLKAVPPVIEAGFPAAYEATITNGGPSAISQLFMTSAFSQPYVATTPATSGPAPAYLLLKKDGVELTEACGENPTAPASGALSCDIGSLAAGSSVTLLVAYNTSGTSDAGITVRWTSVGTATDGDNSRGDVLTQVFDSNPQTPALPPTNVSDHPTNFGGGFALTAGAFADNAPISATNIVSTALTAPAAAQNLVVTVADQDALTSDPACPAQFAPCAPLPTSELHLGDGKAGFGLSKAVISFYKTALNSVNFGKLNVIHIHDDGSAHEVPKKKSCDGTAECAMFENLPGGHGRVTVYLLQNGFVKYH
jgi:hypothetical protein